MTERSHARAALGFRDGDKGTHSSRTLMLDELRLLLAHANATTTMAEYRLLAVEENVLAKPTRTTREHTVRKLKALYGLDPTIPVFRTLVQLWNIDEDSQPLLALLAGFARDPLLRMLAPPVVSSSPGEVVAAQSLVARLDVHAPGRFSSTNAAAIASRVLSTFTQSGHLEGRSEKRRCQCSATPVSAAYAFYLAYLEGMRAQRILISVWAELLDAPHDALFDLAWNGARRGLLDFKQVGSVVELRFPNWLSAAEEELTREQ